MSNPAATAVSEVHSDGLVVKVLTQQLRDHNSVQNLKTVISDGLKSSGAKNLVIDLQDVLMIGSIAFLVLLGVRRELPNGRIIVCNLAANVREVFHICKMSGTPEAPFEEAKTLADALSTCNSLSA